MESIKIKKVEGFLPIKVLPQTEELEQILYRTLRGNSSSVRYSGLLSLKFCKERKENILATEANLYCTISEMTIPEIVEEAKRVGIYREFTAGQSLLAIQAVLESGVLYKDLVVFLQQQELSLLKTVYKNLDDSFDENLEGDYHPAVFSFNPEKDVFATQFVLSAEGKFKPMYLIF